MYYQVDVNFMWGRRWSFRETKRLTAHNPNSIPGLVRSAIIEIARRYSFDCAQLDHPLYPRLLGVEVTPVYEVIHFFPSESGLDEVMVRESSWTKELIKRGELFMDSKRNDEPCPEDFETDQPVSVWGIEYFEETTNANNLCAV